MIDAPDETPGDLAEKKKVCKTCGRDEIFSRPGMASKKEWCATCKAYVIVEIVRPDKLAE